MEEVNTRYERIIVRMAAFLVYSRPNLNERDVEKFVDTLFNRFPDIYSNYTKTEVKNQLIVEVIKVTKHEERFLFTHKLTDSQSKKDSSTSRPPFNAEFILHFLLRPEEQEPVIGCLIESYGRMIDRFGERRANIWFYFEVARSACPLVRRFVIKIIKIAALGEWFRRIIQ